MSTLFIKLFYFFVLFFLQAALYLGFKPSITSSMRSTNFEESLYLG